MVAANSPMLTVPDQSADGSTSEIKHNKYSRKSISSPSPSKSNSTEGSTGHVLNGKNFLIEQPGHYLNAILEYN